jgi:TolB protein
MRVMDVSNGRMISFVICLLVVFSHFEQMRGWREMYPAARTGGAYMHNYYLPPPGTSGPWWPSWSPDGKEIAFSMQGSIWRKRLGEGVAYELTSGSTYDSSPEFSPDGRWLVYTAEENGDRINLMLLDLGSGESKALTRGDHLNLDPAWSPDGSRIAYVSTYPNGYFNVFIVPVDNGVAGEAVQITEDHEFGRNRLYFGNVDLHIQPTWSPDGRELMLVSNRGIPLGSGAIWRVSAVGRDVMAEARLVYEGEQSLYRTRPHWSADGSRLIYSSHSGGEFSHLYILPSEGGQPYKMTFGEWDHFHPRWSPDGRRIAYMSNRGGVPQLHILESIGGRDRRITIRERIYRRPMGTLKVRIEDGETGEVAAARVYLTASDGKTYVPDGTYHRIDRRAQHLFHSEGMFSVEVPAGEVELEVVRGFERWPVKSRIGVSANEVASVKIELPRMADWKTMGWYNGNMHLHMNYGGNLRNTPEHLMLMGAAEDVDVIANQVANKDNRILDFHYFRGGVDPISTDERILIFGQEYRPPFYGHISLYNMRDHLISPFLTGYEGTGLDSLYPSNTDIFRLAREQGAIGGYVHPGGGPRGYLVDSALEVIDYHEVMTGDDHRRVAAVWHRSLNCGFKIPAVGGEDANTSLHLHKIMGSGRTYVFLNELSWENWVEGIVQGRTFVTNGPLLDFRVDGQRPGAEIRLDEGGGRIRIAGRMESFVPIDAVEVFRNGQVIETIPTTAGGHRAQFAKELAVTQSGWYTLRASSAEYSHPVDSPFPFAETSPVYVYVGERPIRSKEDSEYFIARIDGVIEELKASSQWRSEEERRHVLDQYAEARRIYHERALDSK